MKSGRLYRTDTKKLEQYCLELEVGICEAYFGKWFVDLWRRCGELELPPPFLVDANDHTGLYDVCHYGDVTKVMKNLIAFMDQYRDEKTKEAV